MKYEYWFANIKGISNRRKIEIRNGLKRAKELYYMSEADMGRNGISETERNLLTASIVAWGAETEYRKVLDKGVRCIPIVHKEYPERLKEMYAPPYMLYVRGKLPDSNRKTVAIVGARDCTNYGISMAKEFAKVLAQKGIQIVSGMARGIDSASQKSALENGGSSFAVLGCGADICYPREEINLYQELVEKGGVLSEYPVNTSPLKQHFPARNRIISGLSDAVLVMEAREKSGSLITADMALEQGKDVYALPGPVNSKLSSGCNYLIKQGADILLNPENLLEEWGFSTENLCENYMFEKNLLETSENLVYSCLDLQPQNLGRIIAKTGLPVQKILDVLLRLEVMGLVKEISKNYYVKLK